MAITRDELRDRINGTASGVAAMTDLEDATFGRMLNGYNPADASNVSEDDAAQLLADKIVELFEDIIYKDPSKATGTINDVRARLTSSGRLGAAKDAYIKNVMEIAQRRVADITTQLADLKTKYNDQAFVNGLAANVAAVTNKNVREALWKKILEVSNDEVFSQNDDKAKAQADGDAFWTLLNGAMAAAHATETLTTIQNNTDYKNSVDTAWTNVQNGYTGEYRELDKTITKLKSDLGGLVTDALLDADDDRIRGIYSGNTVAELISLANDIDAFLEIASEDEMKEVRDALNETLGIPTATTANVSITSNPAHSKAFTDAVTEIQGVLSAGSVRTTGIDVAAINASINDPATGLQKLYNDAEAAFDAADQVFKEAEFKNNNFSKSLSKLEEAARVATGWEKTLLDAEVARRKDPTATPQAKIETRVLNDALSAMGLSKTFNVQDERDARIWLNDFICDKNLSELVTAVGTNELKDTFKNEINTRFGASAGKIIPLVEAEIFSRNDCIARGEWYAQYSNSELKTMLIEGKRLDATGAATGPNITPVERTYMNDTIRARKSLLSDWFAATNTHGLLPDDKLDVVERIIDELSKREIDLDPLRQTRDDAERDRDTAKTNLEAAQKKVASREGYTRFHTCKDTRDSDLAANAAKRPKIAELKAAEDIKAVYDVLLADALRDLATQQNIDDAAIRRYLSGHGRYSELTGSTYPKKDELEKQLVSEIKRRLSKVKKVTNNSGPKKRSWFKSASAFIAGKLIVGMPLACIPGTPVIGMVAAGTVLGGSLLNAGANLVSRIVHNSATKCPTGRAQKFLNNLNGYTDASGSVHAPKKGFGWGILRGVNKIRKSINKFVEDHPYITRAVQGAASGYLMGEFHEMATGETVWDSVRNWWNGRNNPPSPAPAIPDFKLEEGVEYNMTGFKNIYYGPDASKYAPASGLLDVKYGDCVMLDTRPGTMGVEGWRHFLCLKDDGTWGDYGWAQVEEVEDWFSKVAVASTKSR